MLHFEIESDREVLIDGIGEVPAGEPLTLTDEQVRDFEIFNHVKLAGANLPDFIKVTAVLE